MLSTLEEEEEEEEAGSGEGLYTRKGVATTTAAPNQDKSIEDHHKDHDNHPDPLTNERMNQDRIQDEEEEEEEERNVAIMRLRQQAAASQTHDKSTRSMGTHLEWSSNDTTATTTSTTTTTTLEDYRFLSEPPLPQEGDAPAMNWRSLIVSFWFMGLLNNTGNAIILASAKSISEGGTALVFLANVVPGLLVKLTAPYWFDGVSYHGRMALATMAMSGSFALVANFPSSLEWQLLGVAVGSVQFSLGEASLLALGGRFRGAAVTAFSSGSGLAGVVGFAYRIVTSSWWKWSLWTTLMVAQILAVAYGTIFTVGLAPHLTHSVAADRPRGEERGGGADPAGRTQDENVLVHETGYPENDNDFEEQAAPSTAIAAAAEQSLLPTTTAQDFGFLPPAQPRARSSLRTSLEMKTVSSSSSLLSPPDSMTSAPTAAYQKVPSLDASPRQQRQRRHDHHGAKEEESPPVFLLGSPWQRLQRTISLWPYMIPLFTVYAAEYTIQSGTWTAIGFPIDSEKARNTFYQYSIWMYQVGVLVSRSSGSLWIFPMWVLWLLPALQCGFLVFFTHVALSSLEWFGGLVPLLIPCGAVGLLGGAVYVQGYLRITSDVSRLVEREFALSTVSVAETLGVVVANVAGLFLQACVYQVRHLTGAVASCPVE